MYCGVVSCKCYGMVRFGWCDMVWWCWSVMWNGVMLCRLLLCDVLVLCCGVMGATLYGGCTMLWRVVVLCSVV